jgi:hypothetical protein
MSPSASETVNVNRQKNLLPAWLNLGNLLTIISMSIGGLWVLATMNSAQAVQNAQIAALKENQSRFEQQVMSEVRELRADVKELLRRAPQRQER